MGGIVIDCFGFLIDVDYYNGFVCEFVIYLGGIVILYGVVVV